MSIIDVQRQVHLGNMYLREAKGGLPVAQNLWADCPLLPAINDPTLLFLYENHFVNYLTTMDGLTTTLDTTSTATISPATAGRYGVLALLSHIHDNDEIYVHWTSASVIRSTGRRLWFEAEVKLTEANVNNANISVGLCSNVTVAEAMQDDGAGPYTDYDGILLFKVDGGTAWQAETSVATAQTTLANVAPFSSGSWTRLGFKYDGSNNVTFYVNGAPVGTIGATLPTAAMKLFLGVKAGGANAETLNVDWVKLAAEL